MTCLLHDVSHGETEDLCTALIVKLVYAAGEAPASAGRHSPCKIRGEQALSE